MGAGVAGVATVFAVAPGALADTGDLTPPDTGTTSTVGTTAADSPTQESPDTTPSQVAPSADTPSDANATPTAQKPTKTANAHTTSGSSAAQHKTTKHATAKVAPLRANYGSQKIRLGVKIKDGSFVPPASTTEGSVITITETGPHAPDPATTTCTTGGADTTAVPDSTATFCVFGSNNGLDRRAAGRTPAIVHGPVPPEDDNGNTFATQTYLIGEGDTVTISQTGVNGVLIRDPAVDVIGPCVRPVDDRGRVVAEDLPMCPDFGVYDQYVFEDTGPPPTATPDVANTCAGEPVELDVLKNDASLAPVNSLDITSGPNDGTAKVHPIVHNVSVKAHLAGTSPFAVTYTPKDGFVGKDSFGYTLSTANGPASATASITVIGPPTAADDSATTTSGKAVSVGVTANDHANGGGALSVSKVATPGHGTALVDANAVRYTPTDDFVGTDTFDYTIKTGCGTATATVSVDVTGRLDTNNNNDNPLPDTGVQSQDLLEVSLALLLAGAGATSYGRRRARGRHAG